MKRYLWLIRILSVLALAFPVAAQQPVPEPVGLRPDAPTYALHGPYWVGTREFVIDLDGNESFNITVWYPAQAVDESAEPATYDYGVGGVLRDPMNFIQGTAFRDAAPDINGAPYPLLVFSPGMGTSRMFTLYLLEHLASRGFVVISLDHIGTRLIDQITMEQVDFADQVFLSQARRPLQMHLALDYAETLNAPESDLGGMIDLDKIAFGGYSAGGWAALALAGGQIDLGYLRDWCAQGVYASVIVSTVCNRIAQGTLDAEEQRLMELAGVEAQSGAMWSPITDSRVDAILALAPGGMLTFGEDGLQNVTVPTLILYGSADPMAIPEYNAQWTYDRLGSAHKGMASFADGGHMLFGQCNAAWTMNAPDFCLDSVWDMTRAHDLTNHFATAFLLDVLEGDADAHAALAPDAVAFPGISYEAAGF